MIFQFTTAEHGDIPVIFAQAKHLIDTYEDMQSIDYDKVLSWVERKIEKQIAEYTRVTVNGEICAYYHLCTDGELDDVYVLPGYQSRGIGTQILEKCIEESEAPLYLYVFSRNIRAMDFYRRFGFQIKEAVGRTRYIMTRNG